MFTFINYVSAAAYNLIMSKTRTLTVVNDPTPTAKTVGMYQCVQVALCVAHSLRKIQHLNK